MVAAVIYAAWWVTVMPIACVLTVTDRISDAVEPYFERRAVRRRLERRR